MHKDDDKKYKAKCMRMRQKSMRRSRMLFCLIRMHFAECFCHHPSAYHKDDDKNHKAKCMSVFCHHPSAINPWDIKCCWPWTTFLNTWKIPLEKTLGFFKHLKKCFMGCLVQVSQTPPPAEVSIKCTPQSNRYNTRCLPDIHLFRYD